LGSDDVSCNPITDISGCLKEGIASGMDAIAQSFKDGAEWAIKNLTTAWLNAPSPDVNSSISVTGWIQSHLGYFVAATMVFSVLAAAYRMATTGKFEHGRDLGESLTRVLLVSVLAGTLTTLCVEVGEAFSTWILDKAQVDFSTTVVIAAVQSPGVIILLAIIVIIAQVIQLGLMLIRNAMIVILVGVLPLAAAAGNTQVGRQWWQKSFAWLLAFVLYKPVAALIYAASFKMASKDQDLATQLSGIFMMLLAIFALPALMRFMVPATAAMSGGNAGAMAGAMVGAALATGAVLATGGAAGAARWIRWGQRFWCSLLVSFDRPCNHVGALRNRGRRRVGISWLWRRWEPRYGGAWRVRLRSGQRRWCSGSRRPGSRAGRSRGLRRRARHAHPRGRGRFQLVASARLSRRRRYSPQRVGRGQHRGDRGALRE